MTRVDGLSLNEVIVRIEKVVFSVFSGEPGVRKLVEFKVVGIVDKGASLNATNKGAKSFPLAMVSQE